MGQTEKIIEVRSQVGYRALRGESVWTCRLCPVTVLKKYDTHQELRLHLLAAHNVQVLDNVRDLADGELYVAVKEESANVSISQVTS